jgi:hypothetical protein
MRRWIVPLGYLVASAVVIDGGSYVLGFERSWELMALWVVLWCLGGWYQVLLRKRGLVNG